jgi:exopolysaccharide production protein ExoY
MLSKPTSPSPAAGTQHEPKTVDRKGFPAGSRKAARRVVVVGVPGDVPRALEHPAVGRGGLSVVAALAVDIESEEGREGMERLGQLLDDHQADAIFVAGPIGPATMRRVADLALLYHCKLLAVMPTELLADHEPVIVWSGDSPLVQLAGIPRRRIDSKVKRAADIVCASLGLVVLSPVIAALAVLVRIDSHGSPVFKHHRIGRGGRPFKCLKLRTMRADAEAYLRAHPELYEDYRRNHYKLPEDRDPRVTALGRFLRRSSLDELPQLWNVVKGEMSLVGPRPVVEEELDLYGETRELLLSVRPGLTGAWAVSGRHSVGYPERCGIELNYVRRWNLRQDLAIILRTVRALANPG